VEAEQIPTPPRRRRWHAPAVTAAVHKSCPWVQRAPLFRIQTTSNDPRFPSFRPIGPRAAGSFLTSTSSLSNACSTLYASISEDLFN